MKQFTHFFILVFFSVLFYQSCMIDTHSIKGNGNIVNEEIAISDYNEISVSGSVDVIYEQQTVREPYLQLCVDENILPLVDIKVTDGKLTIKPKENQNIRPSQFKIYTNSFNLSKVSIAGSGEFHFKGEVNSKDLSVNIAGSGDVVSDSLYCEKMVLSIAGSGGADLKGAVSESSFRISGSGSIKAMNFFVQDLTCMVSGSGSIQTAVGEKLNAIVSGSGSIKYKGNPRLETKISGSGSIKNID